MRPSRGRRTRRRPRALPIQGVTPIARSHHDHPRPPGRRRPRLGHPRPAHPHRPAGGDQPRGRAARRRPPAPRTDRRGRARALADPASVQYAETAGIAPLRETVAAHETARCGRTVGPADVVVTSGSQQALDLLARALLDPGDPVVVEDPAYVGALQVFQAAGADLPGCRSTPTACASTCSPTGSPRACAPASCTPCRASTTRAASRSRPNAAGPWPRWPTATASSSSRTTRTACSRSTAHPRGRSPRTATGCSGSAARPRSSHRRCGSGG